MLHRMNTNHLLAMEEQTARKLRFCLAFQCIISKFSWRTSREVGLDLQTFIPYPKLAYSGASLLEVFLSVQNCVDVSKDTSRWNQGSSLLDIGSRELRKLIQLYGFLCCFAFKTLTGYV